MSHLAKGEETTDRGRIDDDGPAAEPVPDEAEPEKPPPQDLKLSLNREENPDVAIL